MESVGLEISRGFSPLLYLQAWEAHKERTRVAESKFQVLEQQSGQSPVAYGGVTNTHRLQHVLQWKRKQPLGMYGTGIRHAVVGLS